MTDLDLDALAARYDTAQACKCIGYCQHVDASYADVPALIAAHRDLTARLAGAEKAWRHWVEVAGEYEGEAIQLRRLLADAEARATQIERDAQSMLAAAVLSCGGEVRIADRYLIHDTTLSRHDDPMTGEVVLRATLDVSRVTPPPQEQ